MSRIITKQRKLRVKLAYKKNATRNRIAEKQLKEENFKRIKEALQRRFCTLTPYQEQCLVSRDRYDKSWENWYEEFGKRREILSRKYDKIVSV